MLPSDQLVTRTVAHGHDKDNTDKPTVNKSGVVNIGVVDCFRIIRIDLERVIIMQRLVSKS